MSEALELEQLYTGFRDAKVIKAYATKIETLAKKLESPFHIMEVCGGHTHSIMKYGLSQLLPSTIAFIHGPGCPVCVIPKGRIDHAIALANIEGVILVTLGDMIKVPGSNGSLQDARASGCDVRFVYSPSDVLSIAQENPNKKIIFFAIGFETTTPMSAALIAQVLEKKMTNIFFHINHVSVPEPMQALLDDEENNIDAFIAPSHVSVIEGSKIYEPFVSKYHKPLVVSGFEPVDVMESLYMLLLQKVEGRCELEVQYTRSVSIEGNVKAQQLNEKFFEKRDDFAWRGLGRIKKSALKLQKEYAHLDAEVVFKEFLPTQDVEDHKLCICGDILKGKAKPHECQVFATLCTPSTPLGSCMVSSEGACAAYFNYANIINESIT